MRKLLIAGLAVAIVLAVASVAMAVNIYTVYKGSTTVRGKGTPTKPIPTGLKFGFTVEDSDPTMRGTVVEKYAIGAEGLRTNPKLFPKCRFTDLDDQSGVPSRCNKALVGRGLVKNAAGSNTNRSLAPGSSSPCNLDLRLYNDGDGMTLRLDSYGRPQPSSFESNEIGCLLPIGTAINGKFVKRRIGGRPANELVFTVPPELKHPGLPQIDNSIRRADATIFREVKRVAGKRRGFYEKVGGKGTKRLVRAKFTTEATSSEPARTFTATKQSRC
jgi:hypothetical protein